MPALSDYEGLTPAWCPGCGNFGILAAFKQAVSELELAPHRFTIVSGIGQAGKFPHYTRCNTFNGLHGRTLPVATGIKLANPIDARDRGRRRRRRLRRGREPPDPRNAEEHRRDDVRPRQSGLRSHEGAGIAHHHARHEDEGAAPGAQAEPLNPLALAVAMDCGFAARAYAGDREHLVETMKEALNHKGFALLDILQPCVTYNRVNTYQWFAKRVYRLDPSYDPADRAGAFAKALEFGDRIPLGVIWRSDRPPFRATPAPADEAACARNPSTRPASRG